MTGFNWAPEDVFGTSGPAFGANPGTRNGDMTLATNTFKAMCIALDDQDKVAYHAHWDSMVETLGEDGDPLGLMVCVGVIFNSFVVRVMAGDTDPTGQPQGTVSLHVFGTDKDTGSFVDTPVEDFASQCIAYACNWQWPDLMEHMTRAKEQVTSKDFLGRLVACLVNLFVGVGGVEQVGWK